MGKHTVLTDAELRVLACLAAGAAPGFEIQTRCGGEFTANAGELYVLLHSLVDRRLLRTAIRMTPDGRQRTFYRLTRSGRACLGKGGSL